MSLPVPLPQFESPPDQYDRAYFEHLIQQISTYMKLANASGTLQGGNAKLNKMPTSAVGLSPGTLYNDAGTVKIVLEE